MNTKQKRIGYLLSLQQQAAERRLTDAFVEMVGALPRRPEPRHWWDNVASPAHGAPFKGREAVIAGRLAVAAAIKTGDAAIIEETARRVAHFADEMKAQMLVEYLSRSGGCTVDVQVNATREAGEAVQAIAVTGFRPRCRATLNEAVRQVREATDSLARWLTGAEAELLSSQKHATGAQL